MIVGILGIVAAVAFWFGVGLVLHWLFTSHDRARPEATPPLIVPATFENPFDPPRYRLYEDALSPDEPHPLANHWSTGPYGGDP